MQTSLLKIYSSSFIFLDLIAYPLYWWYLYLSSFPKRVLSDALFFISYVIRGITSLYSKIKKILSPRICVNYLHSFSREYTYSLVTFPFSRLFILVVTNIQCVKLLKIFCLPLPPYFIFLGCLSNLILSRIIVDSPVFIFVIRY